MAGSIGPWKVCPSSPRRAFSETCAQTYVYGAWSACSPSWATKRQIELMIGQMCCRKWTLNWNEIEDLILVGSCPRSPSDVDRLVDEAGVQSIVCLQSDACFEALKIDWPAIRERALERGVVMTRIAVRDFDHNDQANMLPEAVRALAGQMHHDRRTYVHCTAGINRATLTAVGYLTFVKKMHLDDAVRLVKERRPVAHPYIDCWKTVHHRLLEGRGEEIGYISGEIYKER
eukprot:1195300-Prorocentrum_minimum.AAC.4